MREAGLRRKAGQVKQLPAEHAASSVGMPPAHRAHMALTIVRQAGGAAASHASAVSWCDHVDAAVGWMRTACQLSLCRQGGSQLVTMRQATLRSVTHIPPHRWQVRL